MHDGQIRVLHGGQPMKVRVRVAVNVADGSSHTFNFSWDLTANNRRGLLDDNVTPCTVRQSDDRLRRLRFPV